jgi:N-acetylneuraminic acid mutarotase
MLVPAVAAHATSGGVGTWTTQTNSLPANLLVASSVVWDGYVYVIGGFDGNGPVNTVYSAQIDNSGNVGEWNGQGNTPMPIPLFGTSAVVYNGYIFVIGGSDSSIGFGHPVSTVFSAPLSSGSVGEWTLLDKSLPIPLEFHSAVESNGYVYVTSEITSDPDGNPVPSNLVFSAPLNNDGTTGDWTTQTETMPVATYMNTSVAYNGYLYSFGGRDDLDQTARSDVYSAPISNGTVGPWSTTESLPASLYGSNSIMYNGRVYVIGGGDTTNEGLSNSVYSASLNSGMVGAWTNENNSLPLPLVYSTSVLNNGYVYVISGGTNQEGFVANFVFSAPLLGTLDQTASVSGNNRTTISILAGAIDNPDPSTLTIITQPQHGSATASMNGIVYTPTNGFTGSDSLVYRICSSSGSNQCALVTLSVTVSLQPPTTGFGDELTNPLATITAFVAASIALIALSLALRKYQPKK